MEVTSTICFFSKGISGQLFSGSSKKDGPLNQGENFLVFLGIITTVPTSKGFSVEWQYLQSDKSDESCISARRASAKTQNLLLLFRIKCKVERESDHYIIRSKTILLSCTIDLDMRVAIAVATNSRRGIDKVPPTGQTLHLPNKNTMSILPLL